MRLYLGTFWGSMGLVTISFPLNAPLRITSTRSIKSCLVLKLPINLVWSGVLAEKQTATRLFYLIIIRLSSEFRLAVGGHVLWSPGGWEGDTYSIHDGEVRHIFWVGNLHPPYFLGSKDLSHIFLGI